MHKALWQRQSESMPHAGWWYVWLHVTDTRNAAKKLYNAYKKQGIVKVTGLPYFREEVGSSWIRCQLAVHLGVMQRQRGHASSRAHVDPARTELLVLAEDGVELGAKGDYSKVLSPNNRTISDNLQTCV